MWLRYGVDANNVLVDIEDILSGKTQLVCPYCGTKLTAKKGRIKQHHFAHTDKSCQFMVVSKNRELPTLPLYDDFSIHLSGEELEKLKVLWREYRAKGCSILHFAVPKQFIWYGLLQTAESSALEYQFTHLEQISLAVLPLQEFNSSAHKPLSSAVTSLGCHNYLSIPEQVAKAFKKLREFDNKPNACGCVRIMVETARWFSSFIAAVQSSS